MSRHARKKASSRYAWSSRSVSLTLLFPGRSTDAADNNGVSGSTVSENGLVEVKGEPLHITSSTPAERAKVLPNFLVRRASEPHLPERVTPLADRRSAVVRSAGNYCAASP